MLGGIVETSASFEARSAPRSYPTRYRPFIIENRPGAIATEAVVRSPPDGYPLLLALTNNAGNATLYDKLNPIAFAG